MASIAARLLPALLLIGSMNSAWSLTECPLFGSPNYLTQTYQLNVREVGLFAILAWACAAALLVILGYLSDYLLALTGRLRISRSMLIGVTQLLAALAVVPIAYTHSLPVAIACITVAVAFSMGANASYYAVNVDIVPSRAATALGIMDTGFAISGFLLRRSPVGWSAHSDRSSQPSC